MRKRRLLSLAVVSSMVMLGTIGLVSTSAASDAGEVHIGSFDGPDLIDHPVVVAIGNDEWRLDRKAAYMALTVTVPNGTRLQVLDARTCAALDSIRTSVGHFYEIRFGETGFDSIEDRGNSGWDASLVTPPSTTRCMQLPPTDEQVTSGVAFDPSPMLVVAGLLGGFAFLAYQGLRTRAESRHS